MKILLGDKLATLRNNKNLSVESVSRIIDKSVSTVKSYEANRIIPPINVLMKLAKFYNVSVDELMEVNKKKKVNISGFSKDGSYIVCEIDNLYVKLLERF